MDEETATEEGPYVPGDYAFENAEFGTLRVHVDDAGRAHFNADDVARCLGFASVEEMAAQLDAGEVGTMAEEPLDSAAFSRWLESQ